MNTYERSLRKARREGKTEGVAEGMDLGRAELLLRQMRARFGPLPARIASRLRGAGTDDLDRWAERILTAKTLAEVFA